MFVFVVVSQASCAASCASKFSKVYPIFTIEMRSIPNQRCVVPCRVVFGHRMSTESGPKDRELCEGPQQRLTRVRQHHRTRQNCPRETRDEMRWMGRDETTDETVKERRGFRLGICGCEKIRLWVPVPLLRPKSVKSVACTP